MFKSWTRYTILICYIGFLVFFIYLLSQAVKQLIKLDENNPDSHRSLVSIQNCTFDFSIKIRNAIKLFFIFIYECVKIIFSRGLVWLCIFIYIPLAWDWHYKSAYLFGSNTVCLPLLGLFFYLCCYKESDHKRWVHFVFSSAFWTEFFSWFGWKKLVSRTLYNVLPVYTLQMMCWVIAL